MQLKRRYTIVSLALSVLLIAVCRQAQSQDLHFSQFMHNPLLTNPANTGFNPDYDYRIGGSFRNQWWGLPVPYRTVSIWGDVQVLRDVSPNGWMGIGGVLLSDRAGDGNLRSTKGYASVAWHQELSPVSLLSAGFNVGFASKSVDFLKFKWENQWNGKFFDANVQSGENFAYSRIGYFDLQMGLNYAWFASDNFYLNTGVSAMHLNRPKESFFAEGTTNADIRVPVRYTGFVNAAVKLTDQWILNPNIYYSNQAGSMEWVAGALAQYNLSGNGEQQLLGGVYYRGNDAAIAMVGLQWNDIRLTMSYDATTSQLRSYNNGNGAFEFSLIKFGAFGTATPREARCPAF